MQVAGLANPSADKPPLALPPTTPHTQSFGEALGKLTSQSSGNERPTPGALRNAPSSRRGTVARTNPVTVHDTETPAPKQNHSSDATVTVAAALPVAVPVEPPAPAPSEVAATTGPALTEVQGEAAAATLLQANQASTLLALESDNSPVTNGATKNVVSKPALPANGVPLTSNPKFALISETKSDGIPTTGVQPAQYAIPSGNAPPLDSLNLGKIPPPPTSSGSGPVREAPTPRQAVPENEGPDGSELAHQIAASFRFTEKEVIQPDVTAKPAATAEDDSQSVVAAKSDPSETSPPPSNNVGRPLQANTGNSVVLSAAVPLRDITEIPARFAIRGSSPASDSGEIAGAKQIPDASNSSDGPAVEATKKSNTGIATAHSANTDVRAVPKGTALPSFLVDLQTAGAATSGQAGVASRSTDSSSASTDDAKPKSDKAGPNRELDTAKSNDSLKPTEKAARSQELVPIPTSKPEADGPGTPGAASVENAHPALATHANQPLTAELPTPHQALDATPPVTNPAIPAGRIGATPDGELQIHIAVRTTAFGAVDVHTSVQQNQVGVAINGDRGLIHWVGSEVQNIASGLKDNQLNLARIEFNNSTGLQPGTGSHHDQPEHRDLRPPVIVAAPGEARLDPEPVEMPSAALLEPVANRVSIRI